MSFLLRFAGFMTFASFGKLWGSIYNLSSDVDTWDCFNQMSSSWIKMSCDLKLGESTFGHVWHMCSPTLGLWTSIATKIIRSRFWGRTSKRSRDCTHLMWYPAHTNASRITFQCLCCNNVETFSKTRVFGRYNAINAIDRTKCRPSIFANPGAKSAWLHGGHGADTHHTSTGSIAKIDNHQNWSIDVFITTLLATPWDSYRLISSQQCLGQLLANVNWWDLQKASAQCSSKSSAYVEEIGIPTSRIPVIACPQPPKPPANIS